MIGTIAIALSLLARTGCPSDPGPGPSDKAADPAGLRREAAVPGTPRDLERSPVTS